MAGYFLLLLWIIAAWFLSRAVVFNGQKLLIQSYESCERRFAILASIGIILFTGLRHYTVGPDSDSYASYIDNLHNGIWLNGYDRFEKGFYYLSRLISKVTGSYTVYFLIIALIVMLGYFVYFYTASRSFFWTIFLYITIGPFVFQLTGLRQAIAMALCAASLKFVKDKKFIPFLLLVLLASQFHISALIFLPFYFVARINPSIKSVILFAIGTVVVLYANEAILNLANKILGSDKGYEEVSGGWVNFVTYGGIILASLTSFANMYSTNGAYTYKLLDNTRKYNVISFNLTLLAFLTYFLRYWFRMAERGSKFFMIGAIVLLANYLSSIEDKRTRIVVKMAVVVLAIGLFVYRQTREGSQYGYHFFWQLSAW